MDQFAKHPFDSGTCTAKPKPAARAKPGQVAATQPPDPAPGDANSRSSIQGSIAEAARNHARLVLPVDVVVAKEIDSKAKGKAIGVEAIPAVEGLEQTGYLTSAGKIVHLPDLVADLPVLDARLSSPRHAMEVFLLLQKQLDAGGLRIARLRENALGEWELTLASGLVLQLGNDFLNQRLQRFMTVYRQVLEDEPHAGLHADARYGNGVAVSRPPSLLALDQASSRSDKDKRKEYGFGQ